MAHQKKQPKKKVLHRFNSWYKEQHTSSPQVDPKVADSVVIVKQEE